MADTLEILDLPESGQVQLSVIDESDRRQSAPPVPFPFPLTDRELLELAWLFTGYAFEPFGESRARAEAAEAGLRGLGRLMLESVFRASGEAAEMLGRVSSAEGGPFRLSIVSARPEILSLPWELINDAEVGYVAARAECVARQQISERELPDFSGPSLSERQFNVLMLCPLAAEGIATEALSAMESLDVEVSLDCLRVSSVEELEAHLSERAGHYHLLHLDGMGAGDEGAALRELGSVERIGKAVASAGIPAVLLTCSAVDYSYVAGQALAAAGAPEVALLPIPLGGVGRKLFADAFYAGIARGDGAAAAVAAARRAMMEHPHRPSAAGPMVSWDWITPVVYQSARYAPTAVKPEEPEPVIPGMLPATPEAPPRQLPRGGPYGLMGRRREILELERILDANPVALLSGAVGVGKSEVALGLAAWVEKSGGRPDGVFHTNFDVGAGLDKALHEVGTALAGLEFGDLSAAARRRWLLDYLREHQTLLVWDGVETWPGSRLLEPGCWKTASWRNWMSSFPNWPPMGGQSRVLLVSRREAEPWLSTPHGRYALGGLAGQDRIEFATRLIEESGVDAARLGPEFIELLDLLEGHPLGNGSGDSAYKGSPRRRCCSRSCGREIESPTSPGPAKRVARPT